VYAQLSPRSHNNGRKGPAVRGGNNRGRGWKERPSLSMWEEKITCTVLPVPTSVTKEATTHTTTGKNGKKDDLSSSWHQIKLNTNFLLPCALPFIRYSCYVCRLSLKGSFAHPTKSNHNSAEHNEDQPIYMRGEQWKMLTRSGNRFHHS